MLLQELYGLATVEIVLLISCAASGGIARLAAQDWKCDSFTVLIILMEVLRVVFIAVPVGVMCGLWTKYQFGDDKPHDVLPYAATFCSGVVSLSFVAFLSSKEGIQMIKNFVNRLYGGPK